MTARTASCSCGQLTAVAAEDPIRVSICHCLACQRRTGSVFGAQARFSRRSVTTSGKSKTFVRIGDSGKGATFHFCPDCGSTVYYMLFAHPQVPPPTRSVYEARMHSWVGVPRDIEHLE